MRCHNCLCDRFSPFYTLCCEKYGVLCSKGDEKKEDQQGCKQCAIRRVYNRLYKEIDKASPLYIKWIDEKNALIDLKNIDKK